MNGSPKSYGSLFFAFILFFSFVGLIIYLIVNDDFVKKY